MKKFAFILGALVLAGSTVSAQDMPKKPSFAGFVTNGFWDNWEISLGAGSGTAFSNGDNLGARKDRFGFEGNFAITKWIHPVVGMRALDGLDLRALGPLFDYYLTFAISAEVGVLLRWLDGGMRESVPTMARLMTALMFVRPGDLYDSPIELDIPSFALAAMCSKEDN